MAWTTPRTWVTSEVPDATTMNTHLRDNINYLYNGDPNGLLAWNRVDNYQSTNLFKTGWSNYDTLDAFGPVRFKRVGSWVEIRGLAAGSSSIAAAIVFTLPTGFRPLNSTFSIPAQSSNNNPATAVAILSVSTNGDVTAGGLNQVTPGVAISWFQMHCRFLVDN